ncbi:hypothetical protein QQ054_01345 [Oscillatoria amoena NRMC-F 0135]|nr:hypothetical protein [Oscillatoria amoena NRMC-F 0135]
MTATEELIELFVVSQEFVDLGLKLAFLTFEFGLKLRASDLGLQLSFGAGCFLFDPG